MSILYQIHDSRDEHQHYDGYFTSYSDAEDHIQKVLAGLYPNKTFTIKWIYSTELVRDDIDFVYTQLRSKINDQISLTFFLILINIGLAILSIF